MENLEARTDDIVEFNPTDCFIPRKALRHIPAILKYNDKLMKAYDLILAGLITAGSIGVYYFGYNTLR